MSLFGARYKTPEDTSVTSGGHDYGAKPDRRGPIGGGEGYTSYPKATATVETLDELLAALRDSAPGDVVHIPGTTVIECTERVYVEKMVLEVPEGVILSGDRGKDGSHGALLRSDTFETSPLIRAMGPGVRVTGLRISGPNPRRCLEHHHRSFAEGRGHPYYYRFPTSAGVQTEHANLTVDNCELAGWSQASVKLSGGAGHHVHHNFMHHNQYQGLGYGVTHAVSHSLIERNLFNHNRHSIAGSGQAGSGYVARHNVELGTSLSHCFDMHGGRDRKDGTNTAGSDMKFLNNTFWCRKPSIKIRGLPEEPVSVRNNWFVHTSEQKAILHEGNVRIGKNAWGRRDPRVR